MNFMDLFRGMIVIQLFYSFAITLLVTFMPAAAINYVNVFASPTEIINVEDTGTIFQDSITSQTNVPLIEFGALVFYSSNIFIDLILNFIMAIPEMATLLIKAVSLVFNFNATILLNLQLLVGVAVSILYFLSVINILLTMRAGTSIT